MKPRIYSTALAAVTLASVAFLNAANAATVTLVGQVASSTASTASSSTILTPFSHTGVFTLSTSGSILDEKLSPFVNQSLDYTAISANPNAGSNNNPADRGRAVYNVTGDTTFSVLWGSPDSYNAVTFFSGPAGANGVGTGSVVGTFSLSNLTQATPDKGYDLVTWDISGVDSVEFSDEGQSAFEYADITVTSTPLPAALPVFAGGLGVMGLLGKRRKRKALQAITAA